MSSSAATIRELLAEADRLDTKDLGVLSVKVSELLANRPRPGIPKEEARLLLQINEGLPIELLERAALLHEKRQEETLTVKDQKELELLTTQIEDLHLKRIKNLLKLAQIRGIPLPKLMDELGVKPYSMNG